MQFKVMKGGKDGEKIGPMFPRLHVNDAAEKGGPRAPPRNKMALYEQLSIPSQRFNPVLLPAKPNGNIMFPPSSSNQVVTADRRNCFHPQLPLSKPTLLPEKKSESLKSERSSSFVQLRKRKKSDDEDMTVPVFSQLQEDHQKNKKRNNNRDFIPSIPNYLHHPSLSTKNQKNGPERNTEEAENVDGESDNANKCSQGRENNESQREVEVANAPEPRRRNSPSCNTVSSDDVSETSALDSTSAMDLSPDDVVAVLGQKHFWKARKAIANQQRVFAVQVFELHRLIKVQKMIASSPHLLLEGSTTLRKSSSKSLPLTKPLVESDNKSLSPARIIRDEPEKPAHPVECTAENAVGQIPAFINKSAALTPPTGASLGSWCPPPQQLPGQQQWLVPVMSPTEGLVYKPYPVLGFSSASFFGPYGSSPAMMGNFMNPAYGVPAHQGTGFVPGIPHPSPGCFPPYGMSVMCVGASDVGSGSISAGEQVKNWTEPSNGQVLRQGSNHPQPQSSSNNNIVPVHRTAPTVSSLQTSKVSYVKGSTWSSPANDKVELTETGSSQNPSKADQLQGKETCSFSERDGDLANVRRGNRKDGVPLFPTSTADSERSTQVIRAVPHNARLAPASAARIFKSIQEERENQDLN
ncbi:hypothetical protein SAY87_009679 [Trapa incisa]|uniref:Early flowering 3 n=1 Tax=Trapa incisa TaxID=236973 RepID=A0AAN7JZ61_9MYRT|nr:hypothetical protein SAY87_009679 [Trapa incisa]